MGVKVGVICDTLCSSKCRMGSVKLFLSSHLLKGWDGECEYLAPSAGSGDAPRAQCARIQLAYMGENDENCSLKAGYAR